MGSNDAPQLQHTATHAIECSNATLRMCSNDAPQLQHTATHAIECSNATLRMCSNDAPQKMQSLGAIKKVASLCTFILDAKWWKPRTNSAVIEPK